jgi:hypothetical protein
MNADEKKTIIRIVDELIEPSYRYSRASSYGIKHILESISGIYMHNEEMKSIFLELGYKPNSLTELNPRYKARFKVL